MATVPLPDWPWQVVRRLARARGVRVWVVGGAVRDLLLERAVHDWDFAVDRGALRLARAVADELGGAYFPLDKDRGAGRVVLSPSTRLEAGLADEPRLALDFAALRGADLETDLRARDFTVNALALGEMSVLVDPTGGQADLAARRIRAASERAFRDDPARLLRAVRVAAELGFEIEPQTAAWIRRDASRVALPSAERLRDELARTLALQGAAAHLRRLDEFDLLSPLLPELEPLKRVTQSPPHRFDVWQHTLLTIDALEGVVAVATGRQAESPVLVDVPPAAWGDLARVIGQFSGDVAAHLSVQVSGGRDRALLLKLAALLHDVGKPKTRSQGDDGRIHFHNHERVGAQMASARLQALRFSRDEQERAWVIIGQHLRPGHLARAERVTRRAIYRYFRATACAGVDVVLLSLADHLATWGPDLKERRWGRRLDVAQTLLAHWFERHEETVAPPPLITGDDLMDELGLEPGPEIGRLLEAVREAQAAGEVTTPEEALALAARLATAA